MLILEPWADFKQHLP